jgi:F-type H+-transporting ATPase subunit b
MLELNVTLLVQIGLFLIFAGLMNAVFFKPVARVLEERKAYIDGKHARARDNLTAIEALRSDYEAKIQEARRDSQDRIAQTLKEAETERQALVARLRGDLERQVGEARETIRQERDQALAELETTISDLSGLMASRIAGEATLATAGGTVSATLPTHEGSDA